MEEEKQQDRKDRVPQVDNRTPKISPKTLLAIAVVAVAVAGGALAVANNRLSGSKKSNVQDKVKVAERKEVSQTIVNPQNGKQVSVANDDYFDVSAGTTQYFGKINKINDAYIRIFPTAYKQDGRLVFSGNEAHGPEPITYLRVDKITKLQKLDPNSKEDAILIGLLKTNPANGSDAYPVSTIDKYLKEGQFQAFFFSDGLVFFARSSSVDGNFLIRAGKVLQGQDGAPSQANTQISLVLAKPEQYASRGSADLIYWQNMRNDSNVTKAALDFEKQKDIAH
jgi:hypothetical protein